MPPASALLALLLAAACGARGPTADAASTPSPAPSAEPPPFPPAAYHFTGDLYFQYYGSLYHMPGGFTAGNWSTAVRSTVIVTWPDGSNNTGKFDNNRVGFTGPVADPANPHLLYIIGRALPIESSSSYHLIQVNVSDGPARATGRVLHSMTYQYGNRDAAMGWDPYDHRLFWCRGESTGSSSYYGKCFTFQPGVDTEPQDWGSSGIGTYVKVGNGVRGPATVQQVNGTKYVYFAGKEGVWRQEVASGGVLAGTNLAKLVDQSAHTVFGGSEDVDQLGYGLQYVNATDELFYVSNNRGLFRIANPKDAPAGDGAAISQPLWTFQGHSDHAGLAFDPGHHCVYGMGKGLIGSQPDCPNAAMQTYRVDVGWASDAARAGEPQHPQVVEYVNNCDLSNGGNTDYLAMSWMTVAGATSSPPPLPPAPVPRAVDRRANVTANGLVNSPMRGVVMHVTHITTGVYEYVWSDPAQQVNQKIFICDDGGGGARSNMVYDRAYGWVYVICQQRLLRLDVAGLINAGYGTEGSGVGVATVDQFGTITPTPAEGGLIEVLHDTMVSASSDQPNAQVPQAGWHGYTEHFVYGAGLSLVDGVLYWTTRQYKATVYPTFDLGLWAWRLGRDTAWVPVALIPDTPGGNQAGAVKGDAAGNLYLSIGNQEGDDVNGLWMVSRPFDMFGNTTVRRVLPQLGSSQVYGFEMQVDATTGLPECVYYAMKNETYTDYTWDLSTVARVPWVGNASHGAFELADAAYMGDVYHRGHCTFGCAVWESMGHNLDPTTGLLWLNYKNGDGDHFITSYSFATGKVSDGCYFYPAAASVTHPKFATLLEYGSPEAGQCQCLARNGVPTNAVPGSTALGYCSRSTWMTPISPGADLIGRCNVDECLSCDPDTSPGACSGFLAKCSMSCCNKGYSDGTWAFDGWGGAADYFRAHERCTGDPGPSTAAAETTAPAVATTPVATTSMVTGGGPTAMVTGASDVPGTSDADGGSTAMVTDGDGGSTAMVTDGNGGSTAVVTDGDGGSTAVVTDGDGGSTAMVTDGDGGSTATVTDGDDGSGDFLTGPNAAPGFVATAVWPLVIVLLGVVPVLQ